MLNRILGKKFQILVMVMALLVIVTATVALATTKLIRAKGGGVINVARGVKLVVKPGSLEEDTEISADLVDEEERICLYFGPDGTQFLRPAILRVNEHVFEGIDDLVLYGEYGEEIEPEIRPWGAQYAIDHFSLYYFRRR